MQERRRLHMAPSAVAAGSEFFSHNQPCRWFTPILLIWLGLVGYAWWSFTAYSFQRETDHTASTIEQWPIPSRISVDPNRPALLFFLHPRCPCTRASLSELERLVQSSYVRIGGSKLQLIVVATLPADYSADWLATSTVERALRLPGVELFIDPGGHEANRFGATTSGTVMWFDEQGSLLYAGGITHARGHEGDNVGRDRLAKLIRGSSVRTQGIPALGCKLCLPSAKDAARTLPSKFHNEGSGQNRSASTFSRLQPVKDLD